MRRRYVMIKANEYDQIMAKISNLRWMLNLKFNITQDRSCYEELNLAREIEELLEGDDEE